MISLQKVDNAIKFTFTDSQHYLYGNGEIVVPVNSLILVEDSSEMATFKKPDGDVFVSATYAEFGKTKSELLDWYKTNMVGQNGGGGGVTPGEVETMIDASISGKADVSAITNFFGAVNYDSNTKRINFYNESTTGQVLAYVDATDFIKDGMVDNVEIKTISGTSYLAITFNSDSGKEEIDISLTDIFDPSNYYNKQEVDNLVSAATDDMATQTWVGEQGYITGVDLSNYAEISAVTAVNNALTAHTSDDEIHVNGESKQYWDSKSDFSGSYNDLTDKPTIPTVPTSNTAFTNDAGYITADALSATVATSAITTAVTSASTDAQIPTAKAVYDAIPTGNVIEVTQAEYDALVSAGTVDLDAFYIITDATAIDISQYYTSAQTESAITAAVSGKVNTSDVVTAVTSASTDAQIPTAKAVYDAIPTGGTSITIDPSLNSGSTNAVANSAITNAINEIEEVSAAAFNALNDELSGKQDTLIAGDNITISGNVISASGGGGGSSVNVVQTTGTSTTDVMSQNAVTNIQQNVIAQYSNSYDGQGRTGLLATKANGNGDDNLSIFATKINGKDIISGGYYQRTRIPVGLSLVETSAITSSITSASTDSQVPSAKAVYDAIPTGSTIEVSSAVTSGDTNAVAGGAVFEQLGGLKFVSLTQTEYNLIQNKDANTLYIITSGQTCTPTSSAFTQVDGSFSDFSSPVYELKFDFGGIVAHGDPTDSVSTYIYDAPSGTTGRNQYTVNVSYNDGSAITSLNISSGGTDIYTAITLTSEITVDLCQVFGQGMYLDSESIPYVEECLHTECAEYDCLQWDEETGDCIEQGDCIREDCVEWQNNYVMYVKL